MIPGFRGLALSSLLSASIALGACAPPAGVLSPTADATSPAATEIPSLAPTDEPIEPMIGTEPMAPLLARRSATLAGEELSLALILASPPAFEGQSVQIIGRPVSLNEAQVDVGQPPTGDDLWAIDDGTGSIYVVGAGPPSQVASELEEGEVLLIGRVVRTPEGTPYIEAAGSVVLGQGPGALDARRLEQAEELAAQLEGKGQDVRLARVYIGTAQWLNLSERPGLADRYLDLAYQILEDPARFQGLGESLPPRTPIHAFPTPPGTRIPLPEGERGQ